MFNMNKCAKLFPSIITLTNDAKFKQRNISSSDNDSLTDVSIITETKPKLTSTYDQFVPNNKLFQSLISYANSFYAEEEEEVLYSIQNLNSIKQRNHVPSLNENNQFIQHKTCAITVSEFFSEDNYNDESTTITDGSKFQWEYISDSKSNKTSPIIVREIVKPIKHDEQSKQIIIEYDQINITIDKNINQRKTIKRINPNQYIQQYGSSLYSNEVFHDLFMSIIS